MNIGVLGAGQLGRMMAIAGYPLGLDLHFFDRSAAAPAAQVARSTAGDFGDLQALERFAVGLDLVTYEFENVPSRTAHFLAERVPCFLPPPGALEIAQDRYVQKCFFRELGIPTAEFEAASARDDLDRALGETGVPAVLKTRRWGYDGKGQFILQRHADSERAWQAMDGAPLIVEALVKFEREVSLLAVRSRTGETAFYPLTENRHRDGILRVSLAPAPGIEARMNALAQEHARKILDALNYAGVLTIEYFFLDGRLLANEMATRVHNSGHWTIEGAETSQFENHLRAIAAMPLGSTEPRGESAMVNLIGSVPEPESILSLPGAHLHLYGKEPRPGRKLGHVTVCSRDPRVTRESLEKLQKLAGFPRERGRL
ncbi:MAG: 5-(carboxyamino)imidazole ribonucleotide synthase [Terriglobia bacterium]